MHRAQGEGLRLCKPKLSLTDESLLCQPTSSAEADYVGRRSEPCGGWAKSVAKVWRRL